MARGWAQGGKFRADEVNWRRLWSGLMHVKTMAFTCNFVVFASDLSRTGTGFSDFCVSPDGVGVNRHFLRYPKLSES